MLNSRLFLKSMLVWGTRDTRGAADSFLLLLHHHQRQGQAKEQTREMSEQAAAESDSNSEPDPIEAVA
jgi:hypothetical protein